jgi:hypothetical protein
MRVGAEMRIAIEEIARVALEREEVSRYIGHELGLTEEDLDRVYSVLEGLLNEEKA